MFDALFSFFRGILTNNVVSGTVNTFLNRANSITVFGGSYSFVDYFSLLLALISLIFIIVLCCLFIYRLIRLVGRLFSGGTL